MASCHSFYSVSSPSAPPQSTICNGCLSVYRRKAFTSILIARRIFIFLYVLQKAPIYGFFGF